MCDGGGGSDIEADEEDEALGEAEVEVVVDDNQEERFVSSPLKCHSVR